MNLVISTYCAIKENVCSVNGKKILEHNETDSTIAKALYKQLALSYPKFYKMDILSKYGFIASELILQANQGLKEYKDDEVALLFANSNSCTHTDLRYAESLNNEKPSPSPSLFVYTLPNIVLGEIAIRNKWYGDNMFFILPQFDTNSILHYIDTIFSNKKTKACIIGWINLIDKKNDVFLFCAEKSKAQSTTNTLVLNNENLKKIYKK